MSTTARIQLLEPLTHVPKLHLRSLKKQNPAAAKLSKGLIFKRASPGIANEQKLRNAQIQLLQLMVVYDLLIKSRSCWS